MAASGSQQFDITQVKAAAKGRWADILPRLSGFSHEYFTGRHGPCPRTQGKDKWRFSDLNNDGGAISGSDNKFGDGFATLQFLIDCSFPDSLRLVAEYLGIQPKEKYANSTVKEKTDPAKNLEFLPWSNMLAAFWASKKQPIDSSVLPAIGVRYAKYRKHNNVFAFPAIGQDGSTAGWCLCHATGKLLPIFEEGSREPVAWKKTKTTRGSKAGWVGLLTNSDCEIEWKVEGLTDLPAMMSLGPPKTHSVCTNAFGAGENPATNPWMLERFRGKIVYVLHDCDEPGQSGATVVVPKLGKPRAGWAPAIATVAKEVRNVVLPYPIDKTDGKDLRDWILEQKNNGLSNAEIYQQLLSIAQSSPIIHPMELAKPSANAEIDITQFESEHIDDPHRLARINIKRYEDQYGRFIRYWKETWFTWADGCYEEMSEDHLESRLNRSIKDEFDRAWKEEIATYIAWLKSDDYSKEKDRGAPKARKVTTALTNNVLQATKSLCSLNSSQALHAWTDGKDRGCCVAVKNGILNITNAISPEDPPPVREEIIMSHTPEWFSTTKLNFDFDENAQSPEWHKFLNDVFNGDAESILALQKWFGYLLTPDNSLQKIMFVIGEKRSGKGTIISVMLELFGRNNVVTPTLGSLSREFSLQPLIGKTIAIMPDVRLSDRVDEVTITERLLSISGGDPQDIQRKYKDTLGSFSLKVRFMLFSNMLPRIKDASAAFLSRCIFLRMPNTYIGREDLGLQARLQKELPGILNWAIMGRHYLNESLAKENIGIQQPKMASSLVEEMASIVSPLLQFLNEECVFEPEKSCDTKMLFSYWEKYCEENDIANPGTVQSFGRRIKAIKPSIETCKYRDGTNSQRRCFQGLDHKKTF
jgi:P4 family phage/plasmid primase-like protien